MKADLLTAILTGAYGSAYTQSDHFYNGYRKSITDINWDSVVQDLLLSATQAMRLYELNERYRDYNSWNAMPIILINGVPTDMVKWKLFWEKKNMKSLKVFTIKAKTRWSATGEIQITFKVHWPKAKSMWAEKQVQISTIYFVLMINGWSGDQSFHFIY